MASRSRHSKSASIGSSNGGSIPASAVNGEMLAPATTRAKSGSPAAARKPRSSRSTITPPVVEVSKQGESTHKGVEAAKFVAAVVLSTVLEAGLQSAASLVGTGDLAAVSKRPDNWAEILGLLAWKVLKLGLYWFSGFDAYDVASILLLLSAPQTILLGLFYKISPLTLTTTTLSSVVANSLPYFFLRPLSPSHKPGSAPKSSLRNRPILTDPYTTIATSLLASTIFAVILEASFATYLPAWLITHFAGLRTLDPAHLGASGLPMLLLALIPAGVAAMEFLFAPSTAAPSPTVTTTVFDPATGSIRAHVYHNAWGWYTPRQKKLIGRTALLAYLIVTDSVVQLWGTLAGAEFEGALGYGAIWGAAVIVVGAVLDWVGGPSD